MVAVSLSVSVDRRACACVEMLYAVCECGSQILANHRARLPDFRWKLYKTFVHGMIAIIGLLSFYRSMIAVIAPYYM